MEIEANFEIIWWNIWRVEYFKCIKKSYSLPEVKEENFSQATEVTK